MNLQDINPKEFKLPPTAEVIRGNIIKHGNPLALKGSEIAAWAKELNLPAKGETLLYTGGEYQMLPYIDGLLKTMTIMDQGSKAFSMAMGLRNLINKTGISAEKVYASVLAKDRKRYNEISYKAALTLQKFGLDFCYLGEKELYSGALLYELGFWNDLKTHARKVTDLFKEAGAKTIICLSPHSAELFKFIYPKLVEDFNFEIKTYTEIIYGLIKEKRITISGITDSKVVIHDSCVLARELGITEEMRKILNDIEGVKLVEAKQNRKWTTCCGGPCKILFPEMSSKIADYRANELKETEAELILTFCPYCMASINKSIESEENNLKVEDFIEFIYKGVV